MSDYTPTTEDMREVFVAAVRLSFKDVGASAYSIIRGVTHGGAWFDEWLASEIRNAKAEAWEEGYRQGAYDEFRYPSIEVEADNPYTEES